MLIRCIKYFNDFLVIRQVNSNAIFIKHSFSVKKKLFECNSCVRFCSHVKKKGLMNLLLTMPKESKSSKELRHFRIKNKAAASEKERYPPSNVYVTVLGNGSKGNPRCLCLFADNNRYMFNCGEGSQRLAFEHKMKLTKLEHIFFTHKSWENIGGLAGVSLTMQDAGVPEICLHGPPGIEDLYDMAHRFMNTKNLSITMKTPKLKSFSDYCMKVNYVSLLSNAQPTEFRSEELDIASSTKQNDSEIEKNNYFKRMKFSDEVLTDMSVAYICKINDKAGKLEIEKCVEQGVPPGPLLGLLKKGSDVTLPCGKIVRASDVVSPDEPGSVFIVLECPDERYLDALINEESFKKHQELGDDPSLIASVVFHFSSALIMKHPSYIHWMNRFPTSTVHLSLNSNCSSLSALSIHLIQQKLNTLDSSIFPFLNEIPEKVTENEQQSFTQADSLTRFYLSPKQGLDKTLILNSKSIEEELPQIENFDNVLDEMRKNIMNVQCPSTLDKEYPEIVFLGTGSAIPNKVRNVSSILVNIGPNNPFIMDCGEGTYRQILRFFGCVKTAEILQNLNSIFVSHLHADHHMGLFQLLLEREAVYKEIGQFCPPINVIAPIQIKSWLTNYHQQIQPITHLIRLIPNYLLHFERHQIRSEDYEHLLNILNIKELNTIVVQHCFNSYGLSFTTTNDVKIVYSGDTMPCDSIVKAGKDCSILIHEATMEDDLLEDAIIKTHSTTSQAIEIGRKMNAQFTILTHFSQRYAKIPLYNNNFNSNVAFAFDNMKVQPKQLTKLPVFFPSLKCLFQEDYDLMLKKNEMKSSKLTKLEKLLSYNT